MEPPTVKEDEPDRRPTRRPRHGRSLLAAARRHPAGSLDRSAVDAHRWSTRSDSWSARGSSARPGSRRPPPNGKVRLLPAGVTHRRRPSLRWYQAPRPGGRQVPDRGSRRGGSHGAGCRRPAPPAPRNRPSVPPIDVPTRHPARRPLAVLDAAFVVVLGARVHTQAGEHDAVERGVGLPVASTVEATVVPAAREALDGG